MPTPPDPTDGLTSEQAEIARMLAEDREGTSLELLAQYLNGLGVGLSRSQIHEWRRRQ